MKRTILALLFCAAAAPLMARAGDQALTLKPYFRGLRTVSVTVGARSLNMLFDTGGGATVIAPDVAASMGCTPHGQDTGHRMSGEAVTMSRCETITLSSGAWSRTLAPVGVFDVGALLPSELPHVDGLLALDAFDGRAITLDWARNTVTVVDPARADAVVRATGVPFRRATGDNGRFLSAIVSVRGTRDPLWFLLDSGNIKGLIVNTHVIAESLLPLTPAGEGVFVLGPRPPVSLPFTAESLVIDGAFGTDFLQRGPVTLDLRKR